MKHLLPKLKNLGAPLALITLLLLPGLGWGQTTINLDTPGNWTLAGSATSYAAHSYTESGVTIQGTEVIQNTTTAQDGFPGALGTFSMRLRNTTAGKALITISTGGLADFSIKVRRWDNNPMPNYTVKYTVDGGTNWTSLTSIDGTLLTTSDWFTYSSGTINNVASNIQIEIANTGTTERIMIDDFVWTGYSGGNPTVATPTFDPAGGNYLTSQNVTLSCATAGSTIYYTTDGSDPDNTDTEYTEAIIVSNTTTIKAIAYATDYDPSAIASATYTFPTEVADIATLRAQATGSTWYKLTGEAVLTYQTANRNAKYIQDATGAILIDDNAGNITTSYNLYDGITGITGTLTSYQNMLQFVPVTDPGAATSTGNTVTPEEVTLANLTTAHQAKLVKVLNTTISETGNFAASTNYTLTDGSKGTGVLRTAYTDLNYIGTPIPEVPQDLTGVVLQYNAAIQLVPRSTADFAAADIPWPVTFYVDMTNAPSFTTLEVAGSFNGWSGNAMSLVSNDIYSYTTDAVFDVDDVISFKFRIDGGSTWEQDPNRTYTVVAGTNEYHAVWNVMVPAKITFANVQWPEDGTINQGGEFLTYAQVFAEGITSPEGTASNMQAWVGYSTEDTNPSTWTNWISADYNVQSGNNDEYKLDLGAEISTPGVYYYASRFKLGLADYVYGGFSGGFWNGTTNVSGVLTVNAAEPANHVTGFSATANSHSAITLTWTDSDATGYLIKGSAVSYAAITVPVDGTEEVDGVLVKNIAAGVETFQFTGLTASTPYYFKIYPYNGTAAAINYKTDGTVPQATATTEETPSYAVGDFGFTAASGNWGTTNANWKQWDGSAWNTTPSGAPTITDNVYILSGNTAIVEVSGKNAKNLTVETGAKLYTNNMTMTTPRYLNVSGDIICDGTIGNGANNDDVISFNISGGITSLISGSGSFTANRLRRNNGAGVLNLTFAMDIELRYNGDALYNATTAPDANQAFNVTINDGKHVNLTGNGATPNGGYSLKSVDLANIYGKLSVTGALTNAAGIAGLVIKSSATGTGSLIHSTAGVPATVERYISGHNNVADAGWHLLGSPVAAFDIDGSSFDPGASDDFYAWQESNSTWMNHKQGTPSQIVPGAGYLVSYETSGAKTFTGALNAADQTVTVTREGAGDYAGFNLIGNPFASAITWGNGWLLGSVGGVAYVWDEATKDYIDIEAGDPIPSANGVMVYLGGEETSQSLTIPAAARIHSSQGWYKSAGGRIVLVANDPDRGAAKRSVIRFNESATEGFDLAWDGYYLRGFAPGFYSVSNGMNYSVNTLPSMNNTLVIPMGFEKTVSSGFSIELQESIPGAVVYLTDKKTGTVTNLTDNGAYHFTAAEGDDANRFTLHFGTLGMDDPSTAAPVHIYAYGGVVYLNGLDAKASVTITDLTGRVVMAERVNGNGLAMLNACSLPKGVYVVTAVAGSQVVSAKVIL